ncbi:MAG: hypothetical protein ACK5XN_01170 [Bacteroidota bacterium]|jgi:hypothetical protein
MNAILYVQLTNWQPNVSVDLPSEWKRTGLWYISMQKSNKVVSPIRNVVLTGRVFEINSNMFHPVQVVMQTKVNDKHSFFVEGSVDYEDYFRLAEPTYQKMANDMLNRLRASFDVNKVVVTVS